MSQIGKPVRIIEVVPEPVERPATEPPVEEPVSVPAEPVKEKEPVPV